MLDVHELRLCYESEKDQSGVHRDMKQQQQHERRYCCPLLAQALLLLLSMILLAVLLNAGGFLTGALEQSMGGRNGGVAPPAPNSSGDPHT